MKKYSVLFASLLIFLALSFFINTSADREPYTTYSIQYPTRNLKMQNPMALSTIERSIVPIPQPAFNETVVIIVESTLWGNGAVQTAVNNYRKDLNDTGYNTILYTTPVPNVQALRTLLQGWYISNHITGAVLIGPLPFAQYYHGASANFSPETFVCDLYIMDLDGDWWDINPSDGVYDLHNASIGADIFPEIYVARIDASTRTLGSATNAADIITLLNRQYSYRRGGVSRIHRAITYIDDDWQLWADGTFDNWPAWLNNIYSTRTDIHTPATWTNATDWLTNRLTQNYEFAHLCAHSGANPGTHYFGSGGSGEGTVTSNQIHAQIPTFNFYNLFCCHGADWVTADCLAQTYLFSGSHSLAVVGSTKTGGMLSGTSFYNSLGNNKTIGRALSDWFQGITSYSSEYLEWFYGMTILGDPFLTTHYDCTVLPAYISSSSHPNSNNWYTNQLPQFNWTIPVDVNGISGYYYIIDQNPVTVPTATSGQFISTNGTQPSAPLASGTWFIHVVALDNAGNVGSMATHYQVNIDVLAPIMSITHPVNGAVVGPIFNLNWSVSDAHSGYHYADIYLDGILNTTHLTPIDTTVISGLTVGSHTLQVTVYDHVGNTVSDQIVITVQILPLIPPIPGFPIEAIAIGGILALGFGLIIRRRKQK